MITIYHNPRCSKSRECHVFLTNSEKEFQVINYMETPFSEEKLKKIIEILNIKPIELIRKNEAVWKEKYKDKKMSDDALIKAMIENPKLIQRPIVVNNNKAIIARPLEKLNEIL